MNGWTSRTQPASIALAGLSLPLSSVISQEPAPPGTVEVNGWLLAGIAGAVAILFVTWQAIQNARAERARNEVIEQGPAIMEEARFWELVHAAKRAAGDDMFQRPAELNGLLRAEEPLQVAMFYERYQNLLDSAARPTLRAVADAFIKNCTDANFVAFRDWLISEGKERFEAIVANPSDLPAPEGKEIVTLEAFGYVAPRVYKSKAGQPISRAIEDQIAAAVAKS